MPGRLEATGYVYFKHRATELQEIYELFTFYAVQDNPHVHRQVIIGP